MSAQTAKTSIFLVRHGATDWVGRAIAGRMPGVPLNAEGKRQVERLARRLERESLTAIHSSPLERARQTAEPIAARQALPVEEVSDLTEIDLGAWTGANFEDLDREPDWQLWNAFRSGSRAPGGETMLEVQARTVGYIESLRRKGTGGRHVLVSHGDVIRSALLYYLGLPIDFFRRLEVSPASVSAIEIADHGPRITFLNETAPE